jgi:predicted RNase H-like nuclease
VGSARYLGVDLAWRESRAGLPANETGVAAIDPAGQILDAGWVRGVEEAIAWADAAAGDGDALMFVDAPLVVRNPAGQRSCETQVGQRYGRWKVSANSSNLALPRLAGVRFLSLAQARGWRYSDGSEGPPAGGRVLSESYPYTTLVGAPELGYDTERPRYKRKPRRLPLAQWRHLRAANCDMLISRLRRLSAADPPLLLDSHPVTRLLAGEPSPLSDAAHKHREDLIDALLCAWTAALWARHGLDRCQVLGLPADPAAPALPTTPAATIIAPARPEQRRLPAGAAHGRLTASRPHRAARPPPGTPAGPRLPPHLTACPLPAPHRGRVHRCRRADRTPTTARHVDRALTIAPRPHGTLTTAPRCTAAATSCLTAALGLGHHHPTPATGPHAYHPPAGRTPRPPLGRAPTTAHPPLRPHKAACKSLAGPRPALVS